MKSIIFSILMAVALQQATAEPIRMSCPTNEVFEDCGGCPKTCDNYNQEIMCTADCKSGCFCISDYVRNDGGHCVPPADCPSKPICHMSHESYKECGSACPKTCENYNTKVMCIDLCVPGCFCDYGYVRKSDGTCVRTNKC